MKKIEKNKKKFKLFDMNRDGKGVYENESRNPNLKFFFVLFFRKFTQLLQLNLLMLLQVLPILGVIAIFVFGAKTHTASQMIFAPLYGIANAVGSPALLSKLDLMSIQLSVPYLTPWMIAGIAACGLFLFVTFGWQNVGAAYVLRGLFRGDPVFVFSDFFYGIKKNFKQGLILGMIDFVCCLVLVIDIIFFFTSSSSIMLGIIVAVAIIYFLMRFYFYLLLITFDIKIIKLLKNALIFSVLGVLRNVMASLGIILLIAFHIALVFLLLPMGVSIPIVIPFIYIFAVFGFMVVYAAYPVIEKYMITPYENQQQIEADDIEVNNSEKPTTDMIE